MTAFAPDSGVLEAIARPLIDDHYPDLNDYSVRIEFVWRDKAANSGGKVKLASARKVSGLNAFLSREPGADYGNDYFVLEVARDTWEPLSHRQRVALIDHELAHMGVKVDPETGEFKLVLIPHDLEEFTEIVRRHGLWRDEVKNLVEAAEGHEQLSFLATGSGLFLAADARVAALVKTAQRVEATADLIVSASLLDRRLMAAIAGLDHEQITDEDWTQVVQVLRAAEGPAKDEAEPEPEPPAKGKRRLASVGS